MWLRKILLKLQGDKKYDDVKLVEVKVEKQRIEQVAVLIGK